MIDGSRVTFVRRIAVCQSNSVMGDTVCSIMSWAEVYTMGRYIAPQLFPSGIYKWCLRYHKV